MKLRTIFDQIGKDGKQVYSLLQKNGPLTKNDLLEMLRTNFTTINRVMEPLGKEQLITEFGIGESSGGRKPVLYDLNLKRFYLLGVDISRPYTETIIANPKMDVLYKNTFNMDETYTPEKTVQTIASLFQEGLRQLAIAKGNFLGVGLGTVGPLDRPNGIMSRPKNFAAPGWIGTPIKYLLEQALELPVVIDNGANTAILAEYYYGAGKGYRNIAYFNCSTGIRTGAISAGSIVRTINDAEDAFGHMVINVDGELCNCGNYGCIDCYSSIYAIVHKYIAALKQGRSTVIIKPIDTIDYTDICQAVEQNDTLAKEIIINAATIFGAGLANYINLFNPGLVILSGPLISHSELYYQIASEVASKRLYDQESNQIIFSKGGRFGSDAIALGAAVIAVENCLV
jgi:predicted NBD/HSP70 family sugar kinase